MQWVPIRSEDGFDRYKLINSCWIFNLLDFSSRLLSNSSETLKVMEKSPWEVTPQFLEVFGNQLDNKNILQRIYLLILWCFGLHIRMYARNQDTKIYVPFRTHRFKAFRAADLKMFIPNRHHLIIFCTARGLEKCFVFKRIIYIIMLLFKNIF